MSRRLAFIVAFAALASVRPVFAAPAQGSLVRVASNSAVYYVADDGKRHVFPDVGTYDSWFSDFSGVSVISAAEMAALPLGRNVTRKPGSRMIKIQSDPKVYAVDRGGSLRWVTNEGAAKALYGTGWNRSIDDVSDAFFTDYYQGPAIASAADFNRDAVGAAATIDNDLRARTAAAILAAPGQLVVAAEAPMTARATVLGAVKAEISGFQFTAPLNVGADITAVRLQGYVDQGENDADFRPGSDSDGLTTTFVSDLVPTVGLYDELGNILAGPTAVSADGKVSFVGFHLRIEPGAKRKIFVRGDVSRSVDVGGGADRISFDLTDASKDLTFDVGAATVSAIGSLPNGGDHPPYPATVRRTGKMTFTWNGISGYGIAGKDVLLGTLTAAASNDDFEIRTLSFTIPGPVSSVARLRMESDSGAIFSLPFTTTATFENLGLRVKRGNSANLRLFAELLTPAQGASRSDVIRVSFGTKAPLMFLSSSSSDTFRESSLGSDSASFTSRVSETQIRFTQLFARTLPDSPVNATTRDRDAEVLRFALRADSAGAVRLRTLSFRVTPSDVNTSGSDNDILERWATTVGSGDAESIATLRWSGDGYAEPVGESGSPIGIKYSIADRNDNRDTTPQGRTTVAFDSGVIAYEFPEGSEPIISAGQEASFRFYLDTTWFLLGPKKLTIQALGGHDLQWVDGLEGSPATTIDGTTVSGVPTAPVTLSIP